MDIDEARTQNLACTLNCLVAIPDWDQGGLGNNIGDDVIVDVDIRRKPSASTTINHDGIHKSNL
jgi:hypothetical protein